MAGNLRGALVADVKITLSAHHDGFKPGDSIEVDERTARHLIRAGVAVPATKGAAKAVGADPESAASVRG